MASSFYNKKSRPGGFVVEVAGKAAHLAFEIVALADDVPGEVFFTIPLAAVAYLKLSSSSWNSM